MPVSLFDIATMTVSCSRIQTHQKVCAFKFARRCALILAGGKRELWGIHSVMAR